MRDVPQPSRYQTAVNADEEIGVPSGGVPHSPPPTVSPRRPTSPSRPRAASSRPAEIRSIPDETAGAAALIHVDENETSPESHTHAPAMPRLDEWPPSLVAPLPFDVGGYLACRAVHPPLRARQRFLVALSPEPVTTASFIAFHVQIPRAFCSKRTQGTSELMS